MIRRLERRLTLLVACVLVLVTAGIVLSVQVLNMKNIEATARSALEELSYSRGVRLRHPGTLPEDGSEGISPGQTPPPLPRDVIAGEDGETRPQRSLQRNGRNRISIDMPGGNALASLSNAYTIRLAPDGSVTEWQSDRSDLYTDDQIEAMAAAVLAEGREEGRIGTQYYRFCDSDGEQDERLLVVLDARLEHLSARRALRSVAVAASLACVLLSLGAWLLIRRMLKPVQASMDRQKQFAWDASHELKTPLAVISANAELLSREIGPNEYLGYILSEVRRTDSLVQGLLSLARMDRGTVSARLTRMDLSRALEEVALPFESTVFEAGRTLEMQIEPGVMIRGDEALLQQLAVILLSNALKYSDAGGVIRLSLAGKGRGAVMTVYNTGPGIAPENLTKIFDRFYREDSSHNRDIAGNGLGLSIAATIVEAHKGHIRAESEPGRSATFTVTLPG
ncbi:MAG: HAMP domain-containing histidine kinase [Clostridia bacterium]|nr:HAMP domain-containing histidine kinase [Clostridia bacterium]